jgi:uncharacterized membrane protein YfcA
VTEFHAQDPTRGKSVGVALDPTTIVGKVVVGFIVGTIVGLTGIGGGMLLLPLLISVLGVPPIIAVGSDAVINCATKIGAGWLHFRRGNVDRRLVQRLAYGSIPGAIFGVIFLSWVRSAYGDRVNDFLKVFIGILLIVIPTAFLFKKYLVLPQTTFGTTDENRYPFGVTLIGFIAGNLVGITSIGAGSVILMLLFVLYGYSPTVLIGTDIVHGVLLAGLTGLLQRGFGNVDLTLTAFVLIGSIPGGLLGAHLTKHVPSHRLRQGLCATLVAVGARMLWVTIRHAK